MAVMQYKTYKRFKPEFSIQTNAYKPIYYGVYKYLFETVISVKRFAVFRIWQIRSIIDFNSKSVADLQGISRILCKLQNDNII